MRKKIREKIGEISISHRKSRIHLILTKKTLAYILVLVIAYSLPAHLLTENHSKNNKSSSFRNEEYGYLVFKNLERNALVLGRWPVYTLLNHFKYVVLNRDDVTILSRPRRRWLQVIDENYGKRPVYIAEFDREIARHYRLDNLGGIYYVSGKK